MAAALPEAKPLLPVRAARGAELVRADGTVWVGNAKGGLWATFGDLVALYGDYRETVDELLSTEAHRLKELQAFARDAKIVDHIPTLLAEAPKGAVRYLKNVRHFSSTAVVSYHDQHGRALALVGEAVRSGQMEHLWRALHEEALGLHYLTDLFAPGHDLVDRREAVAKLVEGSAAVAGALHDPLAALLGLGRIAKGLYEAAELKNLHDQFNKEGMEAENLRGTRWHAFGDHRYNDQDAAARMVSVQAARTSLEILLRAVRTLEEAKRRGALEAEVKRITADPSSYEALRFVPARYRNATYHTTFLRRTKKLCDGKSFCDLLQMQVLRRYFPAR
jgi:hypothetical protein